MGRIGEERGAGSEVHGKERGQKKVSKYGEEEFGDEIHYRKGSKMSLEKLNDFGGYKKSLELFDGVVDDMKLLRPYPETHRLISQQIASADSICSNMEEGAGRWSKKEYVQFLIISRGSAAETRGRYLRMKTWLPKELIEKRVALCDEIIGILTSSINKLRKQ